jgi:hypothetical protein
MAVQTQIQVRRGTASSWTSTNPTLAAGELGFETDTGKFKIGTGAATWTSLTYAGGGQNTLTTYQYTATSGQTTFSGVDSNGNTLSYTVGNIQVYLNGVLLVNTAEYTATSGTSIVLGTGAVTGDSLTVTSLGAFTVSSDIPKSTLTAKGSIVTATAGSTPANLSVGANGTVLTADSAETSGLKWATPAAGGLTLISEQVASANSAIDFNSIPGTYKQLILVWSGIVHSDIASSFDIRLNNSASSVYNVQFSSVSNSTASTGFYSNTYLGEYTLGRRANDANIYRNSNGFLTIDNYASSTRAKPYITTYAFYNADATTRNTFTINGVFNSTTAVTSLNIFRTEGTGTFTNTANTSIRLYGLS